MITLKYCDITGMLMGYESNGRIRIFKWNYGKVVGIV